MHTPREGLYFRPTKIAQRIVKFQILDFVNFFFFFLVLLTWDHMRIKVSNDISSERTHQICSQMSCILLARVSTKAVKRIVKFESLHFVAFFFVVLIFFGSLTW